MITDGDVNRGGSPRELAAILKEELGWEIYAIGITNPHLKPDNLVQIASLRQNDHVFYIGEEGESPENVFPVRLSNASELVVLVAGYFWRKNGVSESE